MTTKTAKKPEVVAWGNDPRKMSEADLLPCPNCNNRAGKATSRAAKWLSFVGLWKVSCQRPDCPLAMIYFHPVEWNRLPRIRQSEYEALQAECEKLRKDAERYRWLREQHWSTGDMAVLTSPKSDAKLGAWLPSGRLLDIAIDAAMQEDA